MITITDLFIIEVGTTNTALIQEGADQEATTEAMMKEGPQGSQMQGPNHLITTAKKDKRVGAIRIETV